jgi:pimeloyl-ACP methyl ester carboxylesterase
MFVPGTDSTLIEQIVTDMSSAPPEIALSAMTEMFKHDLTVSLAQVKVPIHLVNSSRYPINVAAGRRHASSFEVTVMEGVGHFLMMEQPAAFNAELEAAIQTLCPGSDPH